MSTLFGSLKSNLKTFFVLYGLLFFSALFCLILLLALLVFGLFGLSLISSPMPTDKTVSASFYANKPKLEKVAKMMISDDLNQIDLESKEFTRLPAQKKSVYSKLLKESSVERVFISKEEKWYFTVYSQDTVLLGDSTKKELLRSLQGPPEFCNLVKDTDSAPVLSPSGKFSFYSKLEKNWYIIHYRI